jgi:general secretion pathway protein J
MTAATRTARASVLQHGFTLLELLVAMFIAAVIFAMGYGVVNQALKSRAALQDQQAKLLELQTTFRVMEQDFVQLAPRPIRQPVGDQFLGALVASSSIQPFASLTRSGWANPSGLQRPALQRVAYYFENGTLRREHWSVLDPTQTSPTQKRELMSHLKSVTLRYMDLGKNWQPQWPAATNAAVGTNLRLRPIAVEITLESEDWGKIVRILEIPG